METSEIETREIEERCKWFIDMLRRESEGENFSSMDDKNNFEYLCYRCCVVNELIHNAKYVYQEDDLDLYQSETSRKKLNAMVGEILSDGFEMNYDFYLRYNYDFYLRYKGVVDLILFHVVSDILEGRISLECMLKKYNCTKG